MNPVQITPCFPTSLGKDANPAIHPLMATSAAGAGRPAPHPVRVAPAPVSGRQAPPVAAPSQSGSSTPGTTASTSGRAGSTGRVQAKNSLETRQWHRPVVFPSGGKALVSPGSSPTLPRQELNAPSSWQSPSGCSPHQQGREDLMQPVRRARSAGRSAGPAAAEANKVSATTRRDSPVRNSSPQDRAGGAKPRRASPQRKKGAAREASRSPEPPRARPPMAAPMQVAPPEKAGSTGSPPPPGATESQSAPSFVKSLARLALVLESNGHSGTGAAAAAAAVAAAVTKQHDCEWMSDFEEYLQEGLERRPLQQEAAAAGDLPGQEAEALRARCSRLEHEVVELRAQLARRLDATMLEVVAARQAAETANTQAAALRAELAAVTGRIEAQRPNGCSPLDVAFS
ncbi:unnamed protein product [Symbiodinium sp. CCMP2456]|nr:unnamed protein product [Symbiodinium sp. CCMP2456]